jgi:two-component system response regulator FlrC
MDHPTVLVVEDDAHMRAALAASLTKAGFPVETAVDVPEARRKVQEAGFGLVLTDLKMPNGSGMEVLREVRRLRPGTPVIVVTAFGTVEKAVEAMKEGAVDFIRKPFSFEELKGAVERCMSASAGIQETGPGLNGDGLVTRDPATIQTVQRARAVAPSRVPVLIQGESGTGKEVLARYIHRASPRRDNALVAINCAAIPENLLESELFGHERGAFTGAHARKIGKFEQAQGGTLLLDEIGEMNLTLQAKLLRVLQEWEVDRVGGMSPVPLDVRIVATTNADLGASVRKGSFREDLFFRLNVIPLTLPPLRERPADIPLLANHFLARCEMPPGRRIDGFTPRAVELMGRHPWRGNVRELKNAVERAVLLSQGRLLDSQDLWLEGWETEAPQGAGDAAEGSVKDMERGLILRTLQREGWNRARASIKLGISVRTLRNKLHEYRREGFLEATQGRG